MLSLYYLSTITGYYFWILSLVLSLCTIIWYYLWFLSGYCFCIISLSVVFVLSLGTISGYYLDTISGTVTGYYHLVLSLVSIRILFLHNISWWCTIIWYYLWFLSGYCFCIISLSVVFALSRSTITRYYFCVLLQAVLRS